MASRKILVTSALPYANGHIHLGHLVEYIQTDIWVRFQKLRGHDCRFFCADDTHGTSVMIRARQEGRSEDSLIAEMQQAHERDFAGFDIVFDNYGSTHSDENRQLCGEVWKSLRTAGLVVEREVTQLFDASAGVFLADRFVKGSCPRCNAKDQYGDNCDQCGSTYSPTDMHDAVSTISGTKPELKSAPHQFIVTEQLHAFLDEWTQSGDHLQTDVAHWLAGAFLSTPLRDWDVSRPAPYFGFEIPDVPGHYWYVWFDAPIGYIASTWQWCKKNGESLSAWWRNEKVEVHHFIGKDITYFHTLFWPVMLKAAGFNLPTKVHVHGFLTVGNEKMSKSKGTFILASTYLKHLEPAYLRYFYATKLTPKLDNLDLDPEEFVTKVNTDLVGKLVNLASRTARFVQSTGLSKQYPDDGGLFAHAASQSDAISEAYENCDYNRATRLVMALADRANKFVEDKEPWKLQKNPEKAQELQDVCTIALNLFRQLVVYLTPVLPRLADQAGELLTQKIEHWDNAQKPLTGTKVSAFKHLLARAELAAFQRMVQETQEAFANAAASGKVPSGATAGGPATRASTARSATSSTAKAVAASGSSTAAAAPSGTAKAVAGGQSSSVGSPATLQAEFDDKPLRDEPLAPVISFDEFAKVDLRVALVLAAEEVAGSKKLLRLTLSLGGTERRNVFAGIKGVYDPDKLVGRMVICAANLEPRKMTFGTSEGMVVAAGPGGSDIFLLSPDSGAKPGQRIH